MESTSTSVSMLDSVPKGMVFERVVDVDAICGDRLRKPGDTTEVEGGISSIMGEAVLDWGSSMVVDLCFLTPTRGLVLLIYGVLGWWVWTVNEVI